LTSWRLRNGNSNGASFSAVQGPTDQIEESDLTRPLE